MSTKAESRLPTLSIVVPVYNGALTLKSCLQAILDTPGPAREVVVVDDASQDDSIKTAMDKTKAISALFSIQCSDTGPRLWSG